MTTDPNGPSPAIEAVATALPGHEIRQSDAEALARRVFDRNPQDVDRLMPVFGNAGIEKRYSCMPLDWFGHPHGWRERNELFERHAVALIERAATTCLERAGKCPADVDAIVCVSTTGITTPSLEARLMERMPFRRDTRRLPIFGLGCAGGVIGLSRAVALQRSMPSNRILLLVVELCTLTFRERDNSKSNFIATALFGDGAAAALIGPASDGCPALGPSGEFTWPDSLSVMGWHVEDDGFGVLFSRDIPDLVRRELRTVTDSFLADHGLSRRELAGYICHPGGKKVLAALEEAYGLETGALATSREVLRDVGNLSAATVMFVLERMLANGLPSGRYLASSLGPGFTAAFQIIEAP